MMAVCKAVTYQVQRRRAGATQTLRRASCAGKTDSTLYSNMKSLADGGNAAFFDGFCKAVGLLGGHIWALAGGGCALRASARAFFGSHLPCPGLTSLHLPPSPPPLSPPQYQAMSLIGYNYPDSYVADAARFAPLLTPA